MKFPKSDEATAYKKYRLDAGLSATEAAKILGITPETLSRRENGKTGITIEAWMAMQHLAEEALQTIWSYLAGQQEPQARTMEAETITAAHKPAKPAKPAATTKPAQAKPGTSEKDGKALKGYAWHDENSPEWEKFIEGHAEQTPSYAQGRNDPCNCGSGMKFKKCCGR